MSDEGLIAEPSPWFAWADVLAGDGGVVAGSSGLPFGRSEQTLLRVVAPELGAAYDEGRIDAGRVAVYADETGPFPDAVVATAVHASLAVAPSLPIDELRDALGDLIDELDEAHDVLLLEAMTRAAGGHSPLSDELRQLDARDRRTPTVAQARDGRGDDRAEASRLVAHGTAGADPTGGVPADPGGAVHAHHAVQIDEHDPATTVSRRPRAMPTPARSHARQLDHSATALHACARAPPPPADGASVSSRLRDRPAILGGC